MSVKCTMHVNKVYRKSPGDLFICPKSSQWQLIMIYLSTPMAVRVKTDTYTVTGWMRYTR